MTRVRVVDNSSLGNTPYHRAPRVIHVYTKNGIGKVGDKVLLAIKGQKKKALIVGHKMPGQRMNPRFDSNNVVLIEDNGNPTGTRIKVPLPTHLRKMEGDYSKVLAIASSFVWHSTVYFMWIFSLCLSVYIKFTLCGEMSCSAEVCALWVLFKLLIVYNSSKGWPTYLTFEQGFCACTVI